MVAERESSRNWFAASRSCCPLLLPLLLLVAIVPSTRAQDLFLLAGQSNMIGHTTSSESVEGDDEMFLDTLSILSDESTTTDEKRDLLFDRYLAAANTVERRIRASGQEDSPAQRRRIPTEVATTESDEILWLFEDGLLTEALVSTPLQGASCSFHEADNAPIRYPAVPVQWDVDCGMSFGHELMLSHTLARDGYPNDMVSVKVAQGGTEIAQWAPSNNNGDDDGEYWPDLQRAIRDRTQPGQFKLFVWHQASADVLEDTPGSTYEARLVDLIAEVRSEMHQRAVEDDAVTTTLDGPDDIPVVIVKLGFWPNFEPISSEIRQVQQDVCDDDARIECVTSDDLGQFFHYDAPSILILGHRIALAYQRLLLEMSSPTNTPVTVQPAFFQTASPSTSPTSDNPTFSPEHTDQCFNDDSSQRCTTAMGNEGGYIISKQFFGLCLTSCVSPLLSRFLILLGWDCKDCDE